MDKRNQIKDFFDVSILVPITGDMNVFQESLIDNHIYFQRNGIELMVIMNGEKEDWKVLPDSYPFINWKIIIATESAENIPAGLLNIGLARATNKYILPIEPGLRLRHDWLFHLRNAQHHYPGTFGVIPLQYYFPGEDRDHDSNNLFPESHLLLMTEQEALILAGGFKEFGSAALTATNLRRRLELAGQREFVIPADDICTAVSVTGPEEFSTGLLADVFYPVYLRPVPAGRQESTVVFDWMKEKSSQAAKLVLQKFKQVHLKDPRVFDVSYNLICLIQVRNETRHLPDVLLHLDSICDGVILLDDDSGDGSYEKALSEKLLIKAQKVNKECFDDLENRNLLLQLSYLFKAEWFFYLDADERFDFRSSDLRSLCQLKDIDTISFRRVHLWNTVNMYRKDLPEGIKGVMHRYRMFRNKGYLQVRSSREIHFCPTPFRRNKYRSAVVLLHYGLLEEASRKKKKEFYAPQDPNGRKQGFKYDFLTDGDKEIEVGNIDELFK
jgi:hypothetical protein